MAIVDLNKIFEKFVKEYVIKNKDKIEGDVTSCLPEIYAEFEKTNFKELDNLTPEKYYEKNKNDLCKILAEHFLFKTEPNEFLVEAVEKFSPEEEVFNLVLGNNLSVEDELKVLEILSHKNSKIAFNRYIDQLFDKNCAKEIINFIAEEFILNVKDIEAKLIERALKEKEENVVVAEILSHSKSKNPKISSYLLQGLMASDKIVEYANFLAEFGDESVTEKLLDYIEEVADYLSFRELKFAIESLGGTCDIERDFTNDVNYYKLNEDEKNEHQD